MMTVAQTILAQLGGSRFVVMTGAKNFVGGDNYLQFDVPASLTKRRVNKVQIILTKDDTYEIKVFKLSRKTLDCPQIGETIPCYVDTLRESFTELTGLAVSL